MTVPKITGYAASAKGLPLESFEYPAPELGGNEVRVAVSYCGVCHTDIQAIDDYYGITHYPFVPGHEIVGLVSELGANVKSLKEGDRVGIGWQGHSCGTCEWCKQGETQLCMDIVASGTWIPYGGFSSSVVASGQFVHPLPDGMPSADAAVLMCAGITVFSALRSSTGDKSLKIGILGVGGLGHIAIQFARAMGHEVTALSSSPGKQEAALGFGAHNFITTGDKTALRNAAYTFDLLLCTANHGIPWERMLEILKKRGKIILVGFPDVTLNSTDLVAHELSLVGSFLGTPPQMREMLSFAGEHGITPMVELMTMAQVNQALEKVRENRARYRIVLVNE